MADQSNQTSGGLAEGGARAGSGGILSNFRNGDVNGGQFTSVENGRVREQHIHIHCRPRGRSPSHAPVTGGTDAVAPDEGTEITALSKDSELARGADLSSWVIYQDRMLSCKLGNPIFYPSPDLSKAERLDEGILIGDVGVFEADGYFSPLFNICYPRTHPIQPLLPASFRPLQFDPVANTALTLAVNASNNLCVSVAAVPQQRHAFTSDSATGAILALPKGLWRTAMLNGGERIKEFVAQRYDTIFDIAESLEGPVTGCGTLHIITGHLKASCWGIASFYGHHKPNPSMSFSLISQTPSNDSLEQYTWSTNHGTQQRVECRTSTLHPSHLPPFPPVKNQTLFVQCVTISRRDGVVGGGATSRKGNHQTNDPQQGSRHGSGGLHRSSTGRGPTSGSRGTGASDNHKVPGGGGLGYALSNGPHRTTTVWHPSTVIAKMMLEMNPTAMVAIVSDDQWISVQKDVYMYSSGKRGMTFFSRRS